MSEHDEHVAVVAHGLLNPMAAVVGGIDLALRSEELPPKVREALGASRRQAIAVTESLRQLAQGLPPEVLAALEDLRRHEPKIVP